MKAFKLEMFVLIGALGTARSFGALVGVEGAAIAAMRAERRGADMEVDMEVDMVVGDFL